MTDTPVRRKTSDLLASFADRPIGRLRVPASQFPKEYLHASAVCPSFTIAWENTASCPRYLRVTCMIVVAKLHCHSHKPSAISHELLATMQFSMLFGSRGYFRERVTGSFEPDVGLKWVDGPSQSHWLRPLLFCRTGARNTRIASGSAGFSGNGQTDLFSRRLPHPLFLFSRRMVMIPRRRWATAATCYPPYLSSPRLPA